MKENIKDKLIRTRASLDTLNKLQKEVIQINDNLFERAIEKRYNGGVSGAGTARYQYGRSFNSGYSKKSVNPYRLMPMEIDIIKRKNVRGKPTKEANKKALKYYSCGKLSHFVKDYRSKNIVFRP